MKKLILFLLIVSLCFGGDWLYKQLQFSSGSILSIDTIEYFYTSTYDVGNVNILPSSFTITHFLTPDTGATSTGDSVDCIISLEFSNEIGSDAKWYSYGNIDTIDLTNAQVKTETEVIGKFTMTTIPDYRYFRGKVLSNTVDTFYVELQKSVEF